MDNQSFRTDVHQSLAMMSGVDPYAYQYDKDSQNKMEEINNKLN